MDEQPKLWASEGGYEELCAAGEKPAWFTAVLG